jgi:NAD-dependent SIR2 family protein deacetylase
LPSLDLDGVVSFLQSDACKRVAFLTGAGVSTGAGIPDFRSPGGMYDTLRPELLTCTPKQRARLERDPMTVVQRSLFLKNPFPYLEVRRPFILGIQEERWRATISHHFMKFLDEDGKLVRVFTQNIDGLDYQTGINPARVTNVHGSIGVIACETCGAPAEPKAFCAELRAKIKDIYGTDAQAPKESSPIKCAKCRNATVKPSTVLFGSDLPEEFFKLSRKELPDVDLLFVAGTSLVVSPANSVVQMVSSTCPRVIVNNEPVGEDLGVRYGASSERDVFLPGACDDTFAELIRRLGWQERLDAVADRLPARA